MREIEPKLYTLKKKKMPYAKFPNNYLLLFNTWEWGVGVYNYLMQLPEKLYLTMRMQELLRETQLRVGFSLRES